MHRAATTDYLCCVPALEDLKGAGRARLTRVFAGAKLVILSNTPKRYAKFVAKFARLFHLKTAWFFQKNIMLRQSDAKKKNGLR